MQTNLKAYAKLYSSVLDRSYCRTLVAKLRTVNWHENTFYDALTDESKSISGQNELDMSYNCYSSDPMIAGVIRQVALDYISELRFDWFTKPNALTPVRFNRYRENRLMAKHCDHIHSLFEGEIKGVPILSVLGVLNSDYTGGELVMWDDDIVPCFEGDIVVFPSSFLYPHSVRPVLSGTRYSFVSWIC